LTASAPGRETTASRKAWSEESCATWRGTSGTGMRLCRSNLWFMDEYISSAQKNRQRDRQSEREREGYTQRGEREGEREREAQREEVHRVSGETKNLID
jgi:hypothetical protein